MATHDLREIAEALTSSQSLLIATHVNPDGDAIGSILALRCLLESLGKQRITCACADPVPRIYAWLPGADTIQDTLSDEFPYDTVVILDASRRERVGDLANHMDGQATVVVIDHHLEKAPEGDLNFVDPTYSSTGEIVLELFDEMQKPLEREAAECVYVALVTDTGGFRFNNTTARTHRAAARLYETGIDASAINARLFETYSLARLRLLQCLLNTVEFHERQRVALSHISLADMASTNATNEDIEGMVNVTRNVEGVEVAIFLREMDPTTTKVSFRSRAAVNSAELAQHFGGGGHAAAAGATLALPLERAGQEVLSHVCEVLGKTQ